MQLSPPLKHRTDVDSVRLLSLSRAFFVAAFSASGFLFLAFLAGWTVPSNAGCSFSARENNITDLSFKSYFKKACAIKNVGSRQGHAHDYRGAGAQSQEREVRARAERRLAILKKQWNTGLLLGYLLEGKCKLEMCATHLKCDKTKKLRLVWLLVGRGVSWIFPASVRHDVCTRGGAGRHEGIWVCAIRAE